MSASLFDTVVVANRGEIALRVFRTAKRLGYATVALYSEADRDALHVRAADRAVFLGGSPPRESYLAIDKVIAATKSLAPARIAVHPGYGFLSENAEFARAVVGAGFTFLGPDAASIDAMGNKSAAKARMIEAGVPCVPGHQGRDQDDGQMIAEGSRIGFPLMVKAAAGGGGRGMRLVHEASTLPDALRSARSEAESAFGSGELLLEKAVVGARHIEIQVFGDSRGNVVHFGERDCSIQRRNQKVVEESPSPAVTDDLRVAMGEAAVKAARAVSYVGAGTVEFLLDAEGRFYFLEMNTRLQVEHAVTEMVYGVDLVEWQLRIAQGEPLPWSQAEVLARRNGHAIEVRLCAEDSEYRPQTGRVLRFFAPPPPPANEGSDLRIDAALEDGTVVSPYYDSMLGKVIAFGADRESARRKLANALGAISVLGIATNRELLRAIVDSERFASGDFSTAFLALEKDKLPLLHSSPEIERRLAALAALALWLDDAQAFGPELAGFESVELAATPILLHSFRVSLQTNKGSFVLSVTDGQESAAISVVASLGPEPRTVRYQDGGITQIVRYARDGDRIAIDAEGRTRSFADRTYAPPALAESHDGTVRATGAGKIVRVHTKPGDSVTRGQSLVVVESMKMELDLTATCAGIVREVHAKVGEQVAAQRILVVIEKAETA